MKISNLSTQTLASQKAGGADSGARFAKTITDLAGQVTGSAAAIEKASKAVAVGMADPTEVATTIAQAELMLESVVNIRDKVISLYNELVRTPI
jgi:flagellar hook-basal body complex protein FliE